MPKKTNVLVLTYWSYKDALIQTYTLPYLKIIFEQLQHGGAIFLVTLEQPHLAISKSELRDIQQQLAEYNIRLVPLKYHKFGIVSVFMLKLYLLKLLFLIFVNNISHIHAWCTPAGSLGYILSSITGVPLIIDSYEPHAEAMVENGTWRKNGIAFKLLMLFEKLQSKRAISVIACSAGMKEYAKKKYRVDFVNNFYTKPACVDFELFSPEKVMQESAALKTQLSLQDKIVCVYSGKFGGIYLEKEIFDFLKIAHNYWEEKFHILLLTSTPKEKIFSLATQSGLKTDIITALFVPHKNIPRYMGIGDFAINPVKPVPTKRYCTSIKDGEYWAMGLPVVITKNISEDSEIVKENNTGAIIESMDTAGYVSAIKKMDALLTTENKIAFRNKIREIAIRRRNFSIAKEIYKDIYKNIVK